MEAPTISANQAKKTLSGRKRKKETIKNVLTKPYHNYWPSLSLTDNKQLQGILANSLPRVKNPKLSVPYKEIKEIPKEKRKNFRETYLAQPSIEIDESERQRLIFGVNDSTKLLESQEAACVLIASDVQPQLLVQHVIDQAVLYNVPILVVENLRQILKNVCGISSAVFTLKKTSKPDSSLAFIQQAVFNIYENYPVPETHINYDRRLSNITAITISDTESDLKDSIMIINDSDEDLDQSQNNYHLKRKSTKERAFIPEKSQKGDSNIEFICLDDTTTTPTTSSVAKNGKLAMKQNHMTAPGPPSLVKNRILKNKQNYKPLVVKRLKGDKNRNKRKMEKFKKKNK